MADGQTFKVFGIGLPRTGTESLSTALNLVGIPTVHGDFDRHPGALDLADPIYERYRGFVDTPFYINFEEAHRRFSDAKFILTTRSLDQWLKSCEMLWEYKGFVFSPTHPAWVYDAMLFGTRRFDSVRFAEVYHQHAASVGRFFASLDEGQQHTIDLENGNDPWPALAGFLGVANPGKPFPHANTSAVIREQLAGFRAAAAMRKFLCWK